MAAIMMDVDSPSTRPSLGPRVVEAAGVATDVVNEAKPRTQGGGGGGGGYRRGGYDRDY